MMRAYHRDFAPLVKAFLGDRAGYGEGKVESDQIIEENPEEENLENE